jgi:hypothetical protein
MTITNPNQTTEKKMNTLTIEATTIPANATPMIAQLDTEKKIAVIPGTVMNVKEISYAMWAVREGIITNPTGYTVRSNNITGFIEVDGERFIAGILDIFKNGVRTGKRRWVSVRAYGNYTPAQFVNKLYMHGKDSAYIKNKIAESKTHAGGAEKMCEFVTPYSVAMLALNGWVIQVSEINMSTREMERVAHAHLHRFSELAKKRAAVAQG